MKGQQCFADRVEHVKRFRALLSDLSLNHVKAAKRKISTTDLRVVYFLLLQLLLLLRLAVCCVGRNLERLNFAGF